MTSKRSIDRWSRNRWLFHRAAAVDAVNPSPCGRTLVIVRLCRSSAVIVLWVTLLVRIEFELWWSDHHSMVVEMLFNKTSAAAEMLNDMTWAWDGDRISIGYWPIDDTKTGSSRSISSSAVGWANVLNPIINLNHLNWPTHLIDNLNRID